MTTDEKLLFDELVAAAGKLATLSNQAATVLSEQFEEMIGNSVKEVRDVLARCPAPGQKEWDGSFNEEDVEKTFYPGSNQSPTAPLKHGVKLVHLPTGIGRESKSKNSQQENLDVARKALEAAVAREFANRR